MNKPGAKYVSGKFANGRLVLTRADGSVQQQPVILMKAVELIDNDDKTWDIQPLEE